MSLLQLRIASMYCQRYDSGIRPGCKEQQTSARMSGLFLMTVASSNSKAFPSCRVGQDLGQTLQKVVVEECHLDLLLLGPDPVQPI